MEKKQIKMTEKKVSRAIIHAAIPTMIQNTSAPLYVMIDTAIIGHLLGTEQLAGLNVGSTLTNALTGICIFISYVTNAQVSKAIGRGKKKAAIEYGRNGAWLALILGIIFMVLLMLFANNIAGLFTQDDSVIEYASEYIHAVSIAIPGILVSMATTGLLRGVKMYKVPMYTSVAGGIFNIVLNILFVVVFNWGIWGSGFATGVTMLLIGAVNFGIMLYFVNKHKISRGFQFTELLEPLIESAPYFVRNFIQWSALLLMVHVIAGVGSEFEAAFQIINACWAFVEISIEALSVPLQTYIAEQVGAKNRENAKFFLKVGIRLSLWLGVFLTVLDLGVAMFAPHVFTDNPTVVAIATAGFLFQSVVFVYTCFTMVMENAMIGAGDAKYMAWMCVVGVIFYLPACYFIEPLIPNNVYGIGIALWLYDVIFLGVRFLMSLWSYKTHYWLRYIEDVSAETAEVETKV
ncbi:MAG: MATE family efflux transporter [Candidatus Ancillula sp.]|jgi:putative MATE family efflux protein|nr:MATE family efflux transporter [Candidatus Ancillula sp.]